MLKIMRWDLRPYIVVGHTFNNRIQPILRCFVIIPRQSTEAFKIKMDEDIRKEKLFIFIVLYRYFIIILVRKYLAIYYEWYGVT